jgi:rubredoxin
MSNYGDQFMTCPMCGALAESECVDVGVGLYITGDYVCSQCDWEIDGPLQPELKMNERESAPPEAFET